MSRGSASVSPPGARARLGLDRAQHAGLGGRALARAQHLLSIQPSVLSGVLTLSECDDASYALTFVLYFLL